MLHFGVCKLLSRNICTNTKHSVSCIVVTHTECVSQKCRTHCDNKTMACILYWYATPQGKWHAVKRIDMPDTAGQVAPRLSRQRRLQKRKDLRTMHVCLLLRLLCLDYWIAWSSWIIDTRAWGFGMWFYYGCVINIRPNAPAVVSVSDTRGTKILGGLGARS